MSGLEIPAFIIGLSGLATVFDKSCATWRTIAAARDFGDDVADWMRMLEMEFFRFQMWWTALEKLAAQTQKPPWRIQYSPASPTPGSPLVTKLRESFADPVISAATSIQKLLMDVEEILRDEGVLAVMQSQNAQNARRQPAPKLLRDHIDDLDSKRRKFASDLMSSISWWKRLKHDATPWRDTSKSMLERKLQEISYWNQSLYDILPHNVRDSVLRQGISGYILVDPQEADPVAKLGQGAVSEIAKLLAARKKIVGSNEFNPDIAEMMRKASLDLDDFGCVPIVPPESNFSILEFSPNGADRKTVLVEWYPYPRVTAPQNASDILMIARERLTKLSLLLKPENKPSTLRALDCLGCLDSDALEAFGLVSLVPPDHSLSKPPVTLNDLLLRNAVISTGSPLRLPSLGQRFSLAVSLASNLYTFMLAQWHHKRFTSLNVMFLFAESADTFPDLANPFVSGYAVSRPSDPGQISIFGSSSYELDMYLHPELRVPQEKMPPYSRKYEIYAFGLLLVELGFWNTLSRISTTKKAKGESLPATSLKSFVINKCTTDLACWMGEQYRDVTLRCLNAGNDSAGGISEDLNDFYWDVVLELVQCCPSAH